LKVYRIFLPYWWISVPVAQKGFDKPEFDRCMFGITLTQSIANAQIILIGSKSSATGTQMK
jgi:hypothetical protein